MFGASIVRQKREKERKERLARGDPPIIPFIKPFPPRFDPKQLPYFKYRQSLAVLGRESQQRQRRPCGVSGGRARLEEENILLYVGLGMSAVGLAVTFVGLGEKGFQCVALQLAGPSTVLLGLCLILLRILLCSLPDPSQSQQPDTGLQSVVIVQSEAHRYTDTGHGSGDTQEENKPL